MTTPLSPQTVLQRVVDIEADKALPKTVRIQASDVELTELAAWLGIPAVLALTADVTMHPWRKRGVRVSGKLSGRVTQTCVVTLEPLDADVSAEFEWHFMPEAIPTTTKRELDLQLEETEVEPLEGGKIDLGAIVAEELSLSLDPHPRKPDASLEGLPGGHAPQPREKPFAALAVLKAKAGPKEPE